MPIVQFMVICLLFAGNDNNVEWGGVTHIDWLERSPMCPVDGESFDVMFQTYHYDLTSARVHVDDGSVTWVDASFSHQRGAHDVWTATIPATSPTGSLEYYFELTDGTDTDYFGPDGMSSSAPASGWALDFATTAHAPIGGTLTSDGGAVFKVWAPNATSANVAGTFNGWNSTTIPMTASGDYFTCRVTPDPNGPVTSSLVPYDQYKYVFNGGTWKPDARGWAWNPSDNNNTFLIDPDARTWGDQDYSTPSWEDMVIYELHVGTFSGKNDGLGRMGLYRDVVDTHLNHLVYLGVNVVELMPITEFDYYESWGYNPINNWGPEEAYGNPEDLKYMIDKLHQKGIAVVLDMVYNHFSYSGNDLWCYDTGQPYFEGDCTSGACDTPWGSQADFQVWEVQEYFRHNILYWLEEFHVDGFRMDATTYMRDPLGCYSEGWSLMQDINDDINARMIDAISIAEELPDGGWITKDTGGGGAGFDSQWHDLFNDNVRQEVFDAAYGNPEMWKIRDAIEGDLNDSTNILSWSQTYTQLTNYVESHDEAGGDGTGQDDERLAVTIDSGDPYSTYAKGRSKLAQGLTILSPGIPMFLQGGEWMEDTQFGSGWSNRIDWNKAASRPEIIQFFRDVISVKMNNGGFRSDAGCEVHHLNDTGNVVAFHRWDLSGNDLIVVASLNNSDLNNYRIGFPQHGRWYELLNSQASDYLGNGSGNGGYVDTDENYAHNGMPHSAEMTVPEMGLLVFRYEQPPPAAGDLNCDGELNSLDIDPFVTALSSAPGFNDYYTNYRYCNPMLADCNYDGTINSLDIDPFVALLTGS